MRTCAALLLLLFGPNCLAQAYPEPEAAAAWRALAAGYVRQALKAQALDRDQALNARVDAVMAKVGAAVAAVDPRFAGATWRAILIEDFGHGAAAFPGQIVLMDAKFVRRLQLGDDELALILAHEAAHVLAGHALEKLSFMAEFVGREKVPTASMALHEFLAQDSYAAAFRPKARLQEREADRLGAAIFFAAGYDAQRGLRLFDKLAQLESAEERGDPGTHDTAETRRQAISQVLAELQRLHAGRGPGER
jgi:predicted Zn-dependent protease